MFVCLLLVLLVLKVESVSRNVSCPVVPPRELDWIELDGKWYIAAVAADIQLHGDCAMVMYSHKSDNTTDVAISWVTNNTVRFSNGTVNLIDDSTGLGDLLRITYTDHTTKTYTFLDVNYEHYAVIFACYNSSDGTSSTSFASNDRAHIKTHKVLSLASRRTLVASLAWRVPASLAHQVLTDEIWKLTRSPHLKATDRMKLDQAVANYSLQATEFQYFNNTEDSCRINGGSHINAASFVISITAALSLFRRCFRSF